VGNGLVPDSIRLDTQKSGLNGSITSLLDARGPETREALLNDSPICGIVCREIVEEFMSGNLSTNNFSKYLISFVSAKLFLDR